MRVRIGATALLLIIAMPISGPMRRAAQRDRDGLEAIERQWLASEHDSATLERILADDFLHPVAAGVFLTKAEHICVGDSGSRPPRDCRSESGGRLAARPATI